MASGAKSPAVGSFYGTSGTPKNIDTVGFRPRLVRVVNVNASGLCRIEWFDGMADAAGVKTSVDGDITVLTTLGITPRANGFTFGADTDLNVDDELCHYEAYE